MTPTSHHTNEKLEDAKWRLGDGDWDFCMVTAMVRAGSHAPGCLEEVCICVCHLAGWFWRVHAKTVPPP